MIQHNSHYKKGMVVLVELHMKFFEGLCSTKESVYYSLTCSAETKSVFEERIIQTKVQCTCICMLPKSPPSRCILLSVCIPESHTMIIIIFGGWRYGSQMLELRVKTKQKRLQRESLLAVQKILVCSQSFFECLIILMCFFSPELSIYYLELF